MSRNKLFLKGSCYESRIDFAPHCCGDDRDGNGTSRYSKSNSRQGKPSLPQAGETAARNRQHRARSSGVGGVFPLGSRKNERERAVPPGNGGDLPRSSASL